MSKKLRVVIVGSKGRMGSVAVEAVTSAADMELVLEVHRADSLEQKLKLAAFDVVLDFSVPESIDRHLAIYQEAQVSMVMGSTGVSEASLESARVAAKETSLGGLLIPNFAMGAVLMMRFAEMAAEHFSTSEILEYHHRAKKDRPSGTALSTRNLISKSFEEQIPIHSIRMDGFLAHQEVLFGNRGETLTIRHDTSDRSCFVPGILLAIRSVKSFSELRVGLQHCFSI